MPVNHSRSVPFVAGTLIIIAMGLLVACSPVAAPSPTLARPTTPVPTTAANSEPTNAPVPTEQTPVQTLLNPKADGPRTVQPNTTRADPPTEVLPEQTATIPATHSGPTPQPTPTPSNGRYPGGGPLDVVLIEEWIIVYINEVREAQGLHPLEHAPAISGIAQGHSAIMAATKNFSTRIDGKGPSDRALAAGYDCRADLGGERYSQGLAENIAKHPRVQRWRGRTSLGITTWWPLEYYEDAQGTAKGIVDGWMGDPQSRDVLLAEKYRRVGVGVGASEEETKGWDLETFYTTVNFSACK